MDVPILEHPSLLVLFVANSTLGLGVVVYDLRYENPQLSGLMKVVWFLVVLYSGGLGLAIYYYSGRRQIRRDSIWRRAFRSVAHCYSGCGAGEAIGVVLAGAIGLTAVFGVSALTFALAYAAGLALTIGPLLADGVALGPAIEDAVYTETASIAVMEAVAIGVDIFLAGNAGPSDVRFWSALYISLAAGLLAAYPVNLLLIARGVKSGMHNPRTA